MERRVPAMHNWWGQGVGIGVGVAIEIGAHVASTTPASSYRGDTGEIQGRCRGDVGEVKGRCRGDVGEK